MYYLVGRLARAGPLVCLDSLIGTRLSFSWRSFLLRSLENETHEKILINLKR